MTQTRTVSRHGGRSIQPVPVSWRGHRRPQQLPIRGGRGRGAAVRRLRFPHRFKGRTAEPRGEVKGLVARATFYMYDQYGLSMSRPKQQLLMAWDRQYSPTAWERGRNRRTAKVMGHPNPFIVGTRSWSLGHKPSRKGVAIPLTARAASAPSPETGNGVIIYNRNSKIYHLPHGCPCYATVSPKNQVPFACEAKALAGGYRKAGNCR